MSGLNDDIGDAFAHAFWRRASLIGSVRYLAQQAAVVRKCSDIPDLLFLTAMDIACVRRYGDLGSRPAMIDRWSVAAVVSQRMNLPGAAGAHDDAPGLPRKLFGAKIRRLDRRGLINGCGCGCRGDLEITDKGRALLRAEVQRVRSSTLLALVGPTAVDASDMGLMMGRAPRPRPRRSDFSGGLRVTWPTQTPNEAANTQPAGCERVAGTWIHRRPHTCPRQARG